MNITYGNKVEIAYVLDNEETILKSESISSIIIDHQYDINHMPIIYVSLNINNTLYDKIVNNAYKGLFRLTISRYNTSSTLSLKRKSINKLFTYIIPTNVDYAKELNKDSDDSYKKGTLALISADSLNDNKKLINDIIRNSNLISIIHKYTNHMSMIIEPFENTKVINQLIIPPTSTLTKLIEMIDSKYYLYKTPYRLFRDFDKTYLLSSSGDPIPDKESNYDSCILNIAEPTSIDGVQSGMTFDDDKRCVNLNINASDTSMDINISKDLQYNTLIGYDINGNVYKREINKKHQGYDEQVLLKYVYEENNIDIELSNANNSLIILNVIKSEIDPSILTPNKEYLVYNYDDYREYDGKYLLSYKKEIIIPQGDEFVSSVVFGLRKVIE